MGPIFGRSLITTLTVTVLGVAAHANMTVCPSGSLTQGIDVSRWQVVTNWKLVNSSQQHFAFIKAIGGTNPNTQVPPASPGAKGVASFSSPGKEDPKFLPDWVAAKQANILRSAYDFFAPSDDAKQQAAGFIAILQKNGAGELPPMLDLEVTGGASSAEILASAQIWLDQVEAWLREDQKIAWTPIIYTDPGFWGALHAPASFARYPLFIADPSHNCPVVPAPWTSWTFWQREPGRVPGIGDAVDLDFFYGTVEMLNAYNPTPPSAAVP